MYKKILAILMLAVMLLSFCACSANDTETGEIAGDDNVVNNETTETPNDNNPESQPSKDNNATDTVVDQTRPDTNGNTVTETPVDDNNSVSDEKENEGTTTTPGSIGTPSDGIISDDPHKTEPEQQPGVNSPANPDPTFDPSGYTYRDYQDMTGEEQEAFFDNFESVEKFFEWLNAAKAQDEILNPSKDIIDGGEIKADE